MAFSLVDIQESVRPIRNPFGFTFKCKYDSKTIVLKPTREGEQLKWVGALRDHVARHLFMAVKHKYHDEQVQALRKEGRLQEAASFVVTEAEENLIYRMITGEDLHKGKRTAEEEQEDIVLSNELSNQLSALDRGAALGGNGGGMSAMTNITAMLQHARENGVQVGEGESAHTAGVIGVSAAPEPEVIDGESLNVGSTEVAASAAEVEANPFAGVQEQLNGTTNAAA